MTEPHRRHTFMDGNGGIAALLILSGLIFGIIFIVAFGPPVNSDHARSAPGAEPLRVVTSLGIFADLAANVGGDAVEVTALIPAEADPHAWDPSIAQIRAVAQADVFIYNGLGLEPWVERTLAGAAPPDLLIVQLSSGLTPLGTGQFKEAELAGGSSNRSSGAIGGSGGTSSGSSHRLTGGDERGVDPHMWLDIQNALRYVQAIEAAFSARRPHDAVLFHAGADAYVAELTALDSWFQQQVDAIPPERRVLITDHDAYVYMAEQYGLTRGGFLVRNPDREPSAREMAQLVDTIRRLHVPAVFAEPHIGTSFIDELARETGASVGILYTDSLGGDVRTYVDMMRANGRSLREHLGD